QGSVEGAEPGEVNAFEVASIGSRFPLNGQESSAVSAPHPPIATRWAPPSPRLAAGLSGETRRAVICGVCAQFASQKSPLAGLVPAIHAFSCGLNGWLKTWMAGTSPAKGYLQL